MLGLSLGLWNTVAISGLVPKEKHGGNSGNQEGEVRWTLRTFGKEKLGLINSQKMWREHTGGGSPNRDGGESLGRSWALLCSSLTSCDVKQVTLPV